MDQADNRFYREPDTELETLRAEVRRLREALEDIAVLGDKAANDWLAKTGSWAMFDEPGSVQIAREALSAKP